MINVPVLKTHFLTTVSLGMKNKKGCLKFKSKQNFHSHGLDKLIAALNGVIKSELTIIDGTYSLEHGPSSFGIAHHEDLIIAGRDVLATDMVGATILGKKPSDIKQFKHYARMNKRSLDMKSIKIKGMKIKDVVHEINHDMSILHNFRKKNIIGFDVKVGKTMCSSCYAVMEICNSILTMKNQDIDCGGIEVRVGGKEFPDNKSANKYILFGRCATNACKGMDNTVPMKGCPPDMVSTIIKTHLEIFGIIRGFPKVILPGIKYLLFRLGIYYLDLGLWDQYKGKPEFDLKHFK